MNPPSEPPAEPPAGGRERLTAVRGAASREGRPISEGRPARGARGRETAPDDWDASRYEEDLARGLVLSGEDSAYFAAARVDAVVGVCGEIGLAPRSILEFGCGTGNNLVFLRRAFPGSRLVGLEPSPAMLAAARSRLAGTDIVLLDPRGGSEGAPDHDRRVDEVPEGTVDLVFVNGVFHHVPPVERPAALAAIRRYLAPGGLLALFENNPLNPGAMWVMRRIPFDRDAQPVWPRSLRRLARAAGFVDLEIRSYFYFPRPLRFLRPLEPALSRLPLGAQYALYARAP